MKINKAKAQAAAQLMADKVFDEKINLAKQSLRQHVECILAQSTPTIVLECCQQYPNLVMATNEVFVYWNARRYYVTISFKVPSTLSRVDSRLDMELRDKLYGLCKTILLREKDKDSYFEKVANTLLALGTRAKIEELFPEACDYIEWPDKKFLPMAKVPFELRALISKAK